MVLLQYMRAAQSRLLRGQGSPPHGPAVWHQRRAGSLRRGPYPGGGARPHDGRIKASGGGPRAGGPRRPALQPGHIGHGMRHPQLCGPGLRRRRPGSHALPGVLRPGHGVRRGHHGYGVPQSPPVQRHKAGGRRRRGGLAGRRGGNRATLCEQGCSRATQVRHHHGMGSGRPDIPGRHTRTRGRRRHTPKKLHGGAGHGQWGSGGGGPPPVPYAGLPYGSGERHDRRRLPRQGIRAHPGQPGGPVGGGAGGRRRPGNRVRR